MRTFHADAHKCQQVAGMVQSRCAAAGSFTSLYAGYLHMLLAIYTTPKGSWTFLMHLISHAPDSHRLGAFLLQQ